MSDGDVAAKALEELNELFGEVHYRMQFTAYTGTLTGSEIRVTVSDAGSKNPRARYSATAVREDDGRRSTGNPSESVFGALAGVHWNALGLQRNSDGQLEEAD